MYLCYDIKGIQQFIFSVPKLKCMIGASGMIARFDREELEDARCVFAGGGRGAFYFAEDQLGMEAKRQQLRDRAKECGLDIRFGQAPTLSAAAKNADDLFSFCPENLDGRPCATSGLWPVAPGQGKTHRLIRNRIDEARQDSLGAEIIRQLWPNGHSPFAEGYQPIFMHNVNPETEVDVEGKSIAPPDPEAECAKAALGNRNRWAIVAMDGNDMGRQFKAFEDLAASRRDKDGAIHDWLKTMSRHLDHCTRSAFHTALRSAMEAWANDPRTDLHASRMTDVNGKRWQLLPFRPLILGGDDLVLLCHSDHALPFVRDMASEFHNQSRRAAANHTSQPLWPATGNELSISAGILYAKISVPLHMAIPYAEALLKSAKSAFRKLAEPGRRPTPAAVDWDVITDTLVDTPAERRKRELRFLDADLKEEVRLTRRPYSLLERIPGRGDLAELLQLKDELAHVPPSVRAKLLPALQRPWNERVAFVASLAKRQPFLQRQLWEGLDDDLGASWHRDPDSKPHPVRETCLPDALMLLEEDRRLAQGSEA